MSGVTRRIFTKRLNCRSPVLSQSASQQSIFYLRASQRVSLLERHPNQLPISLFSMSVSQSWWGVENSINKSIVDLLLRAFGTCQLPIFLLFEPVSQTIVDLLPVFGIDLASSMLTFLSVGTSLDKEGDRSHTHIKSSISNQHPKHQTKNLGYASLRFARLSACLLQWHPVSPLQRLVNLLQ